MRKPRLLDGFCGAGGATKGYQRAGFYVVGVDINPQPHYCGDEFVQADFMNFPLEEYDAIHASPPCQFKTTMSNRWRGKGGLADERVDLLTPTLERLWRLPAPWVVENVTGASQMMPNALLLRGAMFGLEVDRPRVFLSNILLLHPGKTRKVQAGVGVYGKSPDGRLLFRRADGSEQRAAASLAEAQEAMGMDWADWYGTKEAVPPAYTEFIGAQLLAVLERSETGAAL